MAILTTLLLDGDGTIGGTIENDTADTPLWDHASDTPDGGSSDYIQNDNSESTDTAWFSLSNVDADFGSMDTLDIEVDVWAETPITDDAIILSARIADGDASATWLTNTLNVATEADTTRLQRTMSFSSPTGTKAQWDTAHVRFTWSYQKQGGPDNANLRLYGVDFDGTYTVAAGGDEASFQINSIEQGSSPVPASNLAGVLA